MLSAIMHSFHSTAGIFFISSLYFCRAQNNENCAASEDENENEEVEGDKTVEVENARIFGGKEAKYAPWQVLLISKKVIPGKDPWDICGGTIISKKYILTVAHCPRPLYIIAGELDKCRVIGKPKFEEKLPTVEAVHVHHDFKRKPLRNDIAILEVKFQIKPFTFLLMNLPLDELEHFSLLKISNLRKEKFSQHACQLTPGL